MKRSDWEKVAALLHQGLDTLPKEGIQNTNLLLEAARCEIAEEHRAIEREGAQLEKDVITAQRTGKGKVPKKLKLSHQKLERRLLENAERIHIVNQISARLNEES